MDTMNFGTDDRWSGRVAAAGNPDRWPASDGATAADPGGQDTPAPETKRPEWVLGVPAAPAENRAVPDGAAPADLARYCLMLGDDALLLAHRLSAWGVRGPDLEEGAALAAITVDLLDQARPLLARAAELEGAGRDADGLAYHRDSSRFRNVRLAEIDCGPGPGGDFALTVARLLLFASWRHAVFERLAGTRDPVLSAIAMRTWRVLLRHREHAAQWVIRLGDGGPESRTRMLDALQRLWPLTGELFAVHPVERRLAAANCAVAPDVVRADVAAVLDETLSVARLDLPDLTEVPWTGTGGRYGAHTESMPFVLADMQHLVRADPVEP
ncbi:phenylacetate-CoA oxygenase subunit PaaC [Saccharopolyspora gloriosae]|uniref:Ring-1,2-phenylacetyl-CoA epoxidase subunit PaaC n=1 Tax=Saccharopolyspora gloriosae TaxID=455344 RepID=A0A840N848_9PSEU|nr:1,2-phenylacetyl-CoA epoxidase subunit PaaC [Saccharopolyspora gloriosae]MBB5066971.1 ring-1,2-phenylacetyl-CoA epoxidase subunit PaaC [Saccharopolyspora gloriosae]